MYLHVRIEFYCTKKRFAPLKFTKISVPCSVVANTTRVLGKGMVSKSSRKRKSIRILPDSGAMMSHKDHQKAPAQGGGQYELYDA